jgi:hypothetical protein
MNPLARLRVWLLPERVPFLQYPELTERVHSLEEENGALERRLGRVEARVGIRDPQWWDARRRNESS